MYLHLSQPAPCELLHISFILLSPRFSSETITNQKVPQQRAVHFEIETCLFLFCPASPIIYHKVNKYILQPNIKRINKNYRAHQRIYNDNNLQPNKQ
jgi:Zn-finger protein